MKNLIIVYVIIGTLISCNDSEISPIQDYSEIELKYLNDAKILALRQIKSTVNHSARNSIKIPKEYYTPILNDLLSVYNMNELSTRDSVVNHDIHATQQFDGLKLQLLADWSHQLGIGDTITGNKIVDELMEAYDLKVSDFYIGAYDYAFIQSNDILNWEKLASKFKEIEGVQTVFPHSSEDINSFSEDIIWIPSTEYTELIYYKSISFDELFHTEHNELGWAFRIDQGQAMEISCTPIINIGLDKKKNIGEKAYYEILEASIQENCINIKIGISGCSPYNFDLLWRPVYVDCCPEGTNIFLVTTRDQDACDAYFEQDLSFHISTIRDIPKQNSVLNISLINPGSSTQSQELIYRY